MVEPLAVGWHGARMAQGLTPQSTAVILGAGPVGCAVLLALVAKGVTRILVSEPSSARASIAKALGAHTIVNPREADLAAKLEEYTDGIGADFVFDCAGSATSLSVACTIVRAQGQIINLAIWTAPVTFEPHILVAKEASWRPSLAYTAQDFTEVIDALATGALKPQAMITGRIPLENVVDDGFKALHDEGGRHCKILIDLSL